MPDIKKYPAITRLYLNIIGSSLPKEYKIERAFLISYILKGVILNRLTYFIFYCVMDLFFARVCVR